MAILFIKQTANNHYTWCQQGSTQGMEGDAKQLVAACQSVQAVVLLAPAEDVTLTIQPFDVSERKLLAKTIPYALEDELGMDVERLHFALGPIEADQVSVAIVDRALLQHWIDHYAVLEIRLQAVVPEQWLLRWQPAVWTLQIEDSRYIIRYDRHMGCAFSRDTAAFGLQQLAEQALPESVVVYADPSLQPTVQSILPEAVRDKLDWHNTTNYWAALALDQPYLNLLQQSFSRALPWRRWWQQWRVAAALFFLALVVQWLFNYSDWQILKKDNRQLREQTEQVYRKVIPTGQLIDSKRQLQRQVNALKGQSSDGFMVLLDQVAEPLAAIEGLLLRSLNYNEAQAEMLLTVSVPNFKAVEALRVAIERQGLQATMTGSQAEGDRTRARLRIKD